MKEHEKLGQKQVSKVTLHFVWGHFSRKQTVAEDISMRNIFAFEVRNNMKCNANVTARPKSCGIHYCAAATFCVF